MTPTHTLTVSGKLKNLAKIADFITGVAAKAGLTERAIYAVQMAVDEACTNIIEHAYGGEGVGDIQINCTNSVQGLEIIIIDHGQSFNPDQVSLLDPSAPLANRDRRGMGMFFIKNLMDRVEYQFTPTQGNRLILFKAK